MCKKKKKKERWNCHFAYYHCEKNNNNQKLLIQIKTLWYIRVYTLRYSAKHFFNEKTWVVIVLFVVSSKRLILKLQCCAIVCITTSKLYITLFSWCESRLKEPLSLSQHNCSQQHGMINQSVSLNQLELPLSHLEEHIQSWHHRHITTN